MGNKTSEFYDMIGKNSVRNFLKATPYPAGDSSQLDDFFNHNKEIFYDNICISSDREEVEFNELDRRINTQHNNLILIYGYKGCGKTTFIHKYIRRLRESDIRYMLFNFDSFGDDDPIRNTIVGKTNEKIKKDLMDRRQNKSICKSILKIWNYEDNSSFLDDRIDLNNSFREFITQIENIFNHNINLVNNETILQKIKDILRGMSIESLLTLNILFDIAYRIEFKRPKECIILFDNLDVIYSSAKIGKFTRSCSQFYNDAQYIFRNIKYPDLEENYNNPMQNYYMIFIMRETTQAIFIEHFNDRNLLGHPVDVSFVYDKTKILKKRCDYILSHKKELQLDEKKLYEIESINQIFRDDYIERYLFKLFNDDIRTGINTITEISFDINNHLKESIDLRNIAPLSKEDKYFASRGIIFFEIFKLFASYTYFDIIKRTEYLLDISNESSLLMNSLDIDSAENEMPHESSILAINISRIILLYLFNCKKNIDDTETTVPISRLYDDLSRLSYDDTELSKREILGIVNQSLLDLFNLRNKDFWNHLVTFDGLDCVTDTELSNQLDHFMRERYAYKNYGSVRITNSGFLYLNTVLTHFEYFSARVKRSKHYTPLFLKQNLIKCSTDYYVFEKIIKVVFKEVKLCWDKLKKFYIVVFQQKCKYTNASFLSSKFVYRNQRDDYTPVTPLFHIERIVHFHISYIDAFRRYAFYILDHSDNNYDDIVAEKQEINKRLIKYIIDYISLVDDQEISSKASMNLISNYKKCIEKIKKSHNYSDFKTHIDNKTGEEL